MSIGNFEFEVVENQLIVEKIRLLKVKPNIPVDFQAGQYFSFQIADKVNRSYSVASPPNRQTIEFLIEIIEGGLGSTFIDNLRVGDKFDAIGPLGFFTLEKTKALEDNNPIILIATGSGISPIRSILYDLLENKKTSRGIYLYFGLRFDDKSYFFDEFDNLAASYSNLKFYPVISRPSAKWNRFIGHCQDVIRQQPLIPNARIYVCGSNKNVESMINDLVTVGYDKNKIFHEKFG
jgi:CDP-4-dehydro-6-deoxyglucose reductase